MNSELYTYIGLFVIWCVKSMFIPLGVAILAGVIVNKLLQSQPERQRKKRSDKNRLK